jgi:hypothetical protein
MAVLGRPDSDTSGLASAAEGSDPHEQGRQHGPGDSDQHEVLADSAALLLGFVTALVLLATTARAQVVSSGFSHVAAPFVCLQTVLQSAFQVTSAAPIEELRLVD